MTIYVKNKHTLEIDEFSFKCCIGKGGISSKKKEGDKKTPIGLYHIGHLYFRKDRIKKPVTKLKCVEIKKNMGWCDDPNDLNNYNKLIQIKKTQKYEHLYRRDKKYDLLVPIKYNFKKPIKNKGSCIFIHITNNYKATAGCIALKKKDFLILLKLINKKTKIKIT
tara:strand:+ start:1407 stop:1901 length:495 start_codon:yes stop_codon:yes gene_type:complete